MRNLSLFFSFILTATIHLVVLLYSEDSTLKLKRSFRVSVAPRILNSESFKSPESLTKTNLPSSNKTTKPSSESIMSEGIVNEYLNELVRIVETHKYYPALSRRLGEIGEVDLSFTISSKGELLELSIKSASRFERLNKAALKAVQDSGLFPRFPSSLRQDKLDLALSLKFISE